MRLFRPLLSAFLLSFVLLSANSIAVPYQTSIYKAGNGIGQLSPPNYGLRLDGFFGGGAGNEVSFSFDDVWFAEYNDGTARLFGTASVAEFNNTGGPGAYASEWNLDFRFNPTTIASPNIYSSYYMIDQTYGPQMTKVGAETTDFAYLASYPTDGSKPFEVGWVVNGGFGAIGWLAYEHTTPDGIYGDLNTYSNASDFNMTLEPVPEPASILLLGIGLAGSGIARRFRNRKTV